MNNDVQKSFNQTPNENKLGKTDPRFKKFASDLLDAFEKFIGWGTILVIFGGLAYLFFGFLASLSISAFLITTVVIVLLK